jgi:hypothetical protein
MNALVDSQARALRGFSRRGGTRAIGSASALPGLDPRDSDRAGDSEDH